MTQVPILNVYYLLCYAWRHAEESDLVPATELEELETVHDLLGRVLAAGAQRLIRRGLDRGYRERREDLAGLRGKLDLSSTAKRALRARGRVACRFEELSYDVLHNRLLKSTLRDLLTVERLDDRVRAEVRSAYRPLREISALRVTRQAFRRVQLDRNRRLDRFLLAICRLVHESLLAAEGGGGSRFLDFRRDDHTMWKLFEDFVIAFLEREQDRYRVNPRTRRIQWFDAAGDTPADVALIPGMVADVILESPERRIILDTKYYGRSLSQRSTLHSPNLYQLLAYLRNRQASMPAGPRHEGILLYPTVARSLRTRVRLDGFWLEARTVDLAQPWRGIRSELLDAVGVGDR